jgi:hypothetical protein
MASPIVHPQLPLLLAGVPDRVADWLHQAGVPVSPWLPEAAGGFWQRVGRSRREFPGGRFVLYDSRRADAVPDVRLCRRHGLVRLDVARLVYRAPSGCAAGPFANPSLSGVLRGSQAAREDNPARSTFLDRLKSAIEKNGGLWARLADFPFPYRCALSVDGPVAGAELLPRSSADSADERTAPVAQAERIARRYRAGLPMALAGDASRGLRGFPLLWRTTRDELGRWWRDRLRVAVRIEESGTHYRLDCQNLPPEFGVVVELWRGGHVASLPVTGSTMTLSREGLVFQCEPQRHPGGFTSWWPDGTGFDLLSTTPVAVCDDATVTVPA